MVTPTFRRPPLLAVRAHLGTGPQPARTRSRALRVAALVLCAGLVAALGGCAAPPVVPPAVAVPAAQLAAEVRAAELAFARSMAERDFAAFGRFIAEDAVFINGGKPLRGKDAILAFWQRFFTQPAAPFAWQPDLVEVSAGGELGYTEGPVTLATGPSRSRFYTTWRRAGPGRWLVVFDNGYEVCERKP